MMDDAKDYLESSTIYGLSYISTSRCKIVKCFWIVIVCCGFLIAGHLIHNAFMSWNESPAISSTETFAISEADFPEVVVCPPEGSNTALNYDLEMNANKTLGDEFNKALTSLAEKLLVKEYHLKYVEQISVFGDVNLLKSMYRGGSSFALPVPLQFGQLVFEVSTSEYSGIITTPNFGTQFSATHFIPFMIYNVSINIPQDMSNCTLVLELVLDLKETLGGEESVELITDGSEVFRYVENKTIKRELDIGNSSDSQIKVAFTRDLEFDMDGWDNKRMTGFSFRWHFHYKNKTDIQLVAKPSFEGENVEYIKLLNSMLSSSKTILEIWKIVQELKFQAISENISACEDYNLYEKIIEHLLIVNF